MREGPTCRRAHAPAQADLVAARRTCRAGVPHHVLRREGRRAAAAVQVHHAGAAAAGAAALRRRLAARARALHRHPRGAAGAGLPSPAIGAGRRSPCGCCSARGTFACVRSGGAGAADGRHGARHGGAHHRRESQHLPGALQRGPRGHQARRAAPLDGGAQGAQPHQRDDGAAAAPPRRCTSGAGRISRTRRTRCGTWPRSWRPLGCSCW